MHFKDPLQDLKSKPNVLNALNNIEFIQFKCIPGLNKPNQIN